MATQSNGSNGKPKGLYAKLAEVASEIGYVEKNGRNDFHKYDYVTEADLIEAVRSKLTDRNVVLMPSVKEVRERPYVTDKDKQSCVTTVIVAFTFIDADSGETHEAEWAGTGDDAGDKGLYKAYTGALKYFLMKAFQVPTGDDPERDNGRQSAPAVPKGPPIEADRAKALSGLVALALDAGMDPKRLSLAFTATGASATTVNRAAIAALSKAQADVFEAGIQAEIDKLAVTA